MAKKFMKRVTRKIQHSTGEQHKRPFCNTPCSPKATHIEDLIGAIKMLRVNYTQYLVDTKTRLWHIAGMDTHPRLVYIRANLSPEVLRVWRALTEAIAASVTSNAQEQYTGTVGRDKTDAGNGPVQTVVDKT